jgi:hypothetical protein
MIQPGVLMAAERDTLVSQAIHWQEQINGALDRLIELGVDCMGIQMTLFIEVLIGIALMVACSSGSHGQSGSH